MPFLEIIIEALIGTAAEAAADKWIKPRIVLSRVLFGIVMAGLVVLAIVFFSSGEAVAGWVFLGVFLFIVLLLGLVIILAVRRKKKGP